MKVEVWLINIKTPLMAPYLRLSKIAAPLVPVYDDCKLTIRRTSNDGLSVLGGADGDKNALNKSCKRRGKARTTGLLIHLLVAGISQSFAMSVLSPDFYLRLYVAQG